MHLKLLNYLSSNIGSQNVISQIVKNAILSINVLLEDTEK